MATKRSEQAKFRFRKLDRIGAIDAEEDSTYLDQCFVDTGLLTVLRDLADRRRLVLGRTGSGKTALLLRLARSEPRCIRIEPESLALPYVSNSTILDFVSKLGVKLDVFFRLLWRHVFTVELLRHYFALETESDSLGLWQRMQSMLSGNRDKHKEALEYLKKWGKSFWQDTDYRIRELTDKLETDLKAAIGGEIGGLTLGIDAARHLTNEKRQEVVYRAQNVVNAVQIRQLSEILTLIDEIIDDPNKRYFIIVDRLDEDWVDERIRHLLIRALIETVRDFRKVRNVKIVLALRLDLIERVFRDTRDAGFQAEKYESIFCDVDWTESQLKDVLDRRVQVLVRQRYTKKGVRIDDLLPPEIDGVSGFQYLINRTLLKPRDAIMFFNACMDQAENTPVISVDALRKAEGQYSRLRLRALADEWHADYPNLMRYVEIFKGHPSTAAISDITSRGIQDLCLEIAVDEDRVPDDLTALAERVADGSEQPIEFTRALIAMMYKIGLVGAKLEVFESVVWSMQGHRHVSQSELRPDTRVSVHPAFWRALGVKPSSARK